MRRLVLIVALAVGGACTEDKVIQIGGAAAGEDCSQVSDCERGLDCVSNVCTLFDQPDTTGRAGNACMDDASCLATLCCGNQRVCRERLASFPADSCGLPTDSPCGLAADCAPGLVCSGLGLCVEPMAGAAGQAGSGEACETISDCLRPLICGLDMTCVAPPALTPLPCRRSEDELGAFRAYFEVPGTEPVDEFYRLPFPNDVRVVAGHIVLDGHAAPGAVGSVDIAKLYLDAIEADVDGFGLSQPIFTRFSDRVDAATLSVNTATATIFLVDIEPTSPTKNQRVEVQMVYTEPKGQFICGNAVAVAPLDGRPLRKENQYALIFTTRVMSARGETPIRDGDFAPMLLETAPAPAAATPTPAEAAVIRAHGLYAPLRAFLASDPLDAADVAVATVFTTGDPAALAPKIRESVRAAPAPQLTEVIRCAGNAVSPCDEMDPDPEAPPRSCAPGDGFDILHAKVTNPMIQNGTRPYPSPGPNGDQGAILLGNGGLPIVQDTESLCVGIAVPRSRMPAGGWPVVIFSHGTGGNFRSVLHGAIARRITRELQAIVISYDNVMHGPRQGVPLALRQDPGIAFFNATNPTAARDNVLQGAADLFNLQRLAETLSLASAESGLADDLSTDPNRVAFYGHSQGTVVAPGFLAFETNLKGAVLTGAGAEIGLTLINKQKPNDIAGAIRGIFGDQSLTRLHPMIGLLGLYFGPSDAIAYAGLIADTPPMGRGPLNYLHIYGVDDGFTPEVTQAALIRAGGYPVVGDLLRPLDGVEHLAGPVTDNFGGATAAAVQYAPIPMGGTTPDGHFVGVNNPGASATIDAFLGDALEANGAVTITREAD